VCEARLTRLISEFKFTTVKEVLRSQLEASQVGGLAAASV
jgi:hypothetical protein